MKNLFDIITYFFSNTWIGLLIVVVGIFLLTFNTWIFGAVFVLFWICWIVLKFIDHNKPDIGVFPSPRKKQKRKKFSKKR